MRLTTLDRDTPADCRLTIVSAAGNCVLLYRHPSDEDLDVHQWRVAQALAAPADPAQARSAIDRARRAAVITGWEDVCDEDSKPIPFTQPRLLALMLRVPAVEQSVMRLLERLYTLEPIVGEPRPRQEPGTPADALTPGGDSHCVISMDAAVAPTWPAQSE